MCLTGTSQKSTYAGPYCPRTASNNDTSCPGCESTGQFVVSYSKYNDVEGKI